MSQLLMLLLNASF